MLAARRLLAAALVLTACSSKETPAPAAAAREPAAPAPAKELVVYSGRSESLVGPILARFEKEHGVKVKAKYADTAALAALLVEEGARTPAAAFFAQDVGAVGALEKRGLLAELPADLLGRVAPAHRSPAGRWVGVTGRVRTIVYSPARVAPEELPKSVLELTAPRWKGRVGWAPQNASFQAFVTALRLTAGEAGAETWLREMKANEAKEYAKNGAIVQAVGSGAIDVGLVNHYYLLALRKEDPKLAAENHFTAARDAGSLVNLAAFAIPKSAPPDQAAAALALGKYLLQAETQAAFAAETHEYPLVAGVAAPAGLPPLAELEPPVEDLGALHDLEGTLALLRKTAVLP
jgi:iron(III) transport system substrate-binding protein